MQVIKYLMLLLIFAGSTLIGRYMSKKYVYRLEELEELKNVLNIFKSKIKFTYEPIPEIFGEIANNTSLNISKIFFNAKEKMNTETASTSWEKAIDESQNNLNKEDKQVIKSLSKLLRHNRCRRANKSNRSNRELSK